jgi:phosphate-selective porin
MSAGEFKHLENVHDFNPKQGHWGEFELAGRWAFIDLNDGQITGGREQAFSTALNWQLNYNVRMMFDWTYILKTEGPANNDPTNSSTQGLNIIGARAQFAF